MERVLLGLGAAAPHAAEVCWSWAALPTRLPAGTYRLDASPQHTPAAAAHACLGWALGCYAFERCDRMIVCSFQGGHSLDCTLASCRLQSFAVESHR